MPHSQAANLVALRNAIEEMTISVANHPDIILNPSDQHGCIASLVKSLCRSNAGRYKGNPSFGSTQGRGFNG